MHRETKRLKIPSPTIKRPKRPIPSTPQPHHLLRRRRGRRQAAPLPPSPCRRLHHRLRRRLHRHREDCVGFSPPPPPPPSAVTSGASSSFPVLSSSPPPPSSPPPSSRGLCWLPHPWIKVWKSHSLCLLRHPLPSLPSVFAPPPSLPSSSPSSLVRSSSTPRLLPRRAAPPSPKVESTEDGSSESEYSTSEDSPELSKPLSGSQGASGLASKVAGASQHASRASKSSTTPAGQSIVATEAPAAGVFRPNQAAGIVHSRGPRQMQYLEKVKGVKEYERMQGVGRFDVGLPLQNLGKNAGQVVDGMPHPTPIQVTATPTPRAVARSSTGAAHPWRANPTISKPLREHTGEPSSGGRVSHDLRRVHSTS